MGEDEEYVDESVGDDADPDAGEPTEEVVEPDPDATGDHPGDVTNPEYAEELSENRSVPSVELSPNPEDELGRQEADE